MDVEPSSWTMENGHLPWSNFMVHGVNQPLEVFNIHFNNDHLKDGNMQLVCIGNTRVSTDCARKSPWALIKERNLSFTSVPFIHPT